MDETAITPKTITELKQVSPEQITVISEGVLEMTKLVTSSKDELEDLSASLSGLAAAKDDYDRISKRVKGQIRNLVPKL